MTEGCHGANIPCDTSGLTPCEICCAPSVTNLATNGARAAVGPTSAGGRGATSGNQLTGSRFTEEDVADRSAAGIPAKSMEESLEIDMARGTLGGILPDGDIDENYISARLQAFENGYEADIKPQRKESRRKASQTSSQAPLGSVTPESLANRKVPRRGNLTKLISKCPAWIPDACRQEARNEHVSNDLMMGRLVRRGMAASDMVPDIRERLAHEYHTKPSYIPMSEVLSYIDNAVTEQIDPTPHMRDKAQGDENSQFIEFLDAPLIGTRGPRRGNQLLTRIRNADGVLTWNENQEVAEDIAAYTEDAGETKSSAIASLVTIGLAMSSTIDKVKNHINEERKASLASHDTRYQSRRRHFSRYRLPTDDDAIEFILDAVDTKLG